MQPPTPQVTLAKQTRIQYLQKMQHWQATGRVAISDQQQNITASFTWEQNKNKFRIHFYSPFSSETVTITGDGQQINAVTNNGTAEADWQIEQHLPFVQLTAWLKGLAADSAPPQQTYDAHNQLQTLQQDGWLIEYQSYTTAEPVSLPEKMTISNGATKAKLLIKSWKK